MMSFKNLSLSSLSSKSLVRRNLWERGLKTVTIVGAGLMGSGIAQVSAQNGFHVHLVDLNEQLLNSSKERISKSIARIAGKKFKDDASQSQKFIDESMERLHLSTKLDCATKSDLVIEAIVENMDVKHKLFKELDSIAPANCIFASNTSSLPIGEIASVTKREDRFGGVHFFNPVPMMRLVEIIRTTKTSDETHQALLAFGQGVGKSTVECKDTPGFVVNRLLVPYLVDAVAMLERGDATAPDIDTAMKLGAGYPMGPFELLDYVGLDTIKFIMDGWVKKFPDNPSFQSSKIVEGLVKEGKLGIKSGEGFYKYDKKGTPIKK